MKRILGTICFINVLPLIIPLDKLLMWLMSRFQCVSRIIARFCAVSSYSHTYAIWPSHTNVAVNESLCVPFRLRCSKWPPLSGVMQFSLNAPDNWHIRLRTQTHCWIVPHTEQNVRLDSPMIAQFFHRGRAWVCTQTDAYALAFTNKHTRNLYI